VSSVASQQRVPVAYAAAAPWGADWGCPQGAARGGKPRQGGFIAKPGRIAFIANAASHSRYGRKSVVVTEMYAGGWCASLSRLRRGQWRTRDADELAQSALCQVLHSIEDCW